MHVTPALSSDQIISTQIKPLQRQLNVFFNEYTISINAKAGFLTDFKRLFNELFSVRLPVSVEQRAHSERQLVLSIRQKLKRDQLVLRRTTDQMNIFYLTNAHDFKRQSSDCFNRITSYERIANIADSNSLQAQLNEICKSIDTVLLQLRRQGRIQENQLMKMSVKRANIALPHLYFLPESGQHDLLKLCPTISSCRRCPIQPLASYLDNLLRPLYENHRQTMMVMNGMDFIGKLARFNEYSLLPRTQFSTFKIIDVYMRVSHDLLDQALGRFLVNVLTGNRHQNLTIETIQQLTSLVLRNNIFTYDDHLYRYIRGSPLGLPLTRTLVNIYLHDWQTTLVNRLSPHNEFYARYHDTVFIAWQQSIEQLQVLLEELNQKHPNISIEYSVGKSVHFLGVYVENQSGQLYTRVYHDPNRSRFTLPYVIGHPRLLYRQWCQWALTRAVRYCTSIEDFHQERINVELTLLSNGFPLGFVELGVNTFLKKHFAEDLRNSIAHRPYTMLRQRLFGLIQLEKQHRQQQEQWKINNQLVHLQYLYDWGPRIQFKTQFRILWLTRIVNDHTLKNRDLIMKLTAIHCYPLNSLFSQK